jgi:ATP-dependent RNA helicase DDX1
LGDIEDHLVITIQQIDKEMKVPMNEFDGKVVYGEKIKKVGSGYKDHVAQLMPIVESLTEMETLAQRIFLRKMKLY